jgi:hypothetical protein
VTRRRGALQRVRAGDEAEFAFYAVPGLVYKGQGEEPARAATQGRPAVPMSETW